MRTEILNDFNEFASINEEVESILNEDNRDKQNSMMNKIKEKTEKVLRSKIKKDGVQEFSLSHERERSNSLLLSGHSASTLSPLDVMA